MAADLRGQSLSVSEICERLDSARRRRPPDTDLETPVETPRIPYYSDLRSVDRTRIPPLKVEEHHSDFHDTWLGLQSIFLSPIVMRG